MKIYPEVQKLLLGDGQTDRLVSDKPTFIFGTYVAVYFQPKSLSRVTNSRLKATVQQIAGR
jgi:hypothetical protein